MVEFEAIETRYAGCRFRSRLEARWAVVFDALNLKWRYEAEGFEFCGTRYLPDFFVKGIGWIEIKPEEQPLLEEILALKEVVINTEHPGYILAGDIPDTRYGYFNGGQPEDLLVWSFFPNGTDDDGHWFCICPVCGKVGIEWQARGNRVCGYSVHEQIKNDRGNNGDHHRIISAINAGRSARFEYGESA